MSDSTIYYSKLLTHAFVLSFAMVCTLLSGLNVVAFAADGDLDDTIAIWCGYYAPNGDHLYRDEAEIDKAVAQNHYVKEDLRWYAPKTSSTKIKSAWNQYSGEHLLYHDTPLDNEFIALHPEWVPDEFVIYSDDNKGVPIYRMFNPAAVKADTHIYVTEDKIAEGIAYGYYVEDDAPFLYGVDKVSAEVKLVDEDGLQASGTALPTDLLKLSYGSELGVPSTIIWYRDGAAVAVYSIQGGGIVGGFDCDALRDAQGAIPEGDYYVQVENTEGRIFTTNTITVSTDQEAVISGLTIADNYDALALATKDDPAPLRAVDCDTETGMVVIDVTMNKLYDGKFYILPADMTTITADYIADPNYVETNPEDSGFVDVKTSSNLTNENLWKKGIMDGASGIYYKANDGSMHYKMIAEQDGVDFASLTRGDDYVVVFAPEDDDIQAGDDLEDLVVTDAATCPYLMAPTSIDVVDAQPSTMTAGWGAQLSFGELPAAYVNGLANAGAMEIGLYSIDETAASVDDATLMDGDYSVLIGGKTYSDGFATASTAESTEDDQYVFATWYAPEGIFGEEEVELVSDVVEVAPLVASGIEIDYDVTEPKNVTADLDNVKTDCMAVLVTADYDTDYATTAGNAITALKDSGKYVSMAMVSKGQGEVVFEDAISKVKDTVHGDTYAVVLQPLGEGYSPVCTIIGTPALSHVAGDVGMFEVVGQFPASYKLNGGSVDVASSNTGAAVTAKKVMVSYDQFGSKLGDADIVQADATFNPASSASTEVGVKISATNGIVTVQVANADLDKQVTKGDQYKYKLSDGQYLTATCTTSATADSGDLTWKLTITSN